MVFGNIAAFWLWPILILILILGFWGWGVKRKMAKIWLSEEKVKKSQIKKYVLAVIMAAIMIFTIAVPRIPFALPTSGGKEGLVVFMVDVSASMAAQKDLNSPSRLERIKPMLYRAIDEFPEAKFYPFGFTDIARSLTPPLTKEDFPYLKGSIARVLDINSVPGDGTGFGVPISQVINKITKEEKAKIIILFSDGEFFSGIFGSEDSEEFSLGNALRKAVQENVKIVTVGVGEKEGSRIPLYNPKGEFTGEFAKDNGKVFTAYLEDKTLKSIALKTGGKYFSEEDFKGVIDFLEKNLEKDSGKENNGYRDMSYLLLIPVAGLWLAFARFYLK